MAGGALEALGILLAYGFLSTMPLHLLRKNWHVKRCERKEPMWWMEKEKAYEDSLLKKFLEEVDRQKAQATD